MAAQKAIPWAVVAGLALVVWWLFFRKPSQAAALAADVATGKTIPIPDFGTDALLDAADAIASERLTLPTGTTAKNSSQ